MDKAATGDSACCLPNAEGVTYLQIGSQGFTVGMQNLESVFSQLWKLHRRPDELGDTEVLGLTRRFNYIPDRPSVAADYAAALRKAYAAFCARQEHQPNSAR